MNKQHRSGTKKTRERTVRQKKMVVREEMVASCKLVVVMICDD
jgi:hypothetical protein